MFIRELDETRLHAMGGGVKQRGCRIRVLRKHWAWKCGKMINHLVVTIIKKGKEFGKIQSYDEPK